MHEQRHVSLGDAVEQRGRRVERVGCGQRARGHRDADASACEHVVDVVGIGVVERERTPGGEAVPERLDAVEVCVDQRPRLVAGERLDADRARQCDHRKLDAVIVEQASAPGRALRVQVDRARALARRVQLRDAAAEPDEGQLVPGRERLDQRGGPDVLVYVEAHRVLAARLAISYQH